MGDAHQGPATVEFAVQMTCESCENSIRDALTSVPGVRKVTTNVSNESVLVESSLPSSRLQELIEQTGRKAVLRGMGVPGSVLGAAVVEFYGFNGIQGVARFLQMADDDCIVDGTLDGLTPGKHGLAVCESGDLSNGCESVGNHYNPHGVDHGTPKNGHLGDLGNIDADQTGRSSFRFHNSRLKLSDLIGRALAVHSREDDYGAGSSVQSKIDGNAGPKIACGIIARAAGLQENNKKICSCSGDTLWEERAEAQRKKVDR